MHKITQKHILALTLIIFLGVALSACQAAEPKLDINMQKTGFAQTAEVQATLTSAAQPTATQTPVPTLTFTPAPTATNTPIIPPTKTSASNTSAPSGGIDGAQVIAQEPEDNTSFQPGETFTVTWTLMNTGTTTWSIRYYIEYASGESLGAEDKVYIWLPVPPGTNLQLAVNMVAPDSPGSKTSNWKMFDAEGNAFYDFSIAITVGE